MFKGKKLFIKSKKLKIHVPKVVRNTLISIVALVVLFVGGATAYTYLMGRNPEPEVAAAISTETPPSAEPFTRRPAQAADVPASASVQSITSPVAPGSNVSMTVRTNPAATCTIVVKYNEIPSTDSGLVEKVADDYGVVSWTWTVEETVPEGKWPAEATCKRNEKSAVVRADIVVKR